MDQLQELLHGIDHAGTLQLLIADQIAERPEIDLHALQQLVYSHNLLLCAERRGLVRVLQIGLYRLFLRHLFSQDFPHFPKDIFQSFFLCIVSQGTQQLFLMPSK